MDKAKDIMAKELLYVNFYDKVLDVAKKMFQSRVGSALVQKDGTTEGILTERDIIRDCVVGANNIFNTRAGVVMSDPVIGIGQDSSVIDACHMMQSNEIKKIAVMKKENVVGIITITDIIDYLAKKEVKDLLIERLMTRKVIYADAADDIIDVSETMKRVNVGSVVVMKNGVPAGIVTERDIIKGCVSGEKNFIKTTAEDIMSSPLVMLNERQKVAEAIQKMSEARIKKIIVTDSKDEICGIITQTDIAYNIDSLV